MSEAHEPIRIAHVVTGTDFAGVETLVLNYYRHIDKNNIQFDFFMNTPEPTHMDAEILSMGGHIFKLPAYADGMGKNLARFRQILQDNSYSIIHCHMNSLSVFWLREAKKAGIPIRIVHSHSTAGKGEGFKNAMKYALRPFSKVYPTHFCACSEYAGRWLFGNKLYNTGKVKVIQNAIDVEKFSFNPETRGRMRKELKLEDRFVVGHVGRFMWQKNHDFLIDIFKEVHRQNPKSSLLLVGEGPLEEKIRQKVSHCGLSKSVLFLGNRSDVPNLMQAMDAFLLPSNYEGLPIVLVEAQCGELPCYISSSITPEVVLRKECVRLDFDVPPTAWATKILENEACYARTASSHGLIEENYSIRKKAAEMETFYSMLLQQHTFGNA